MFSIKASWEPRITTSFIGELILLFSNPLTSHIKHVSIVSINKTQLPEFTAIIASSKLFDFFKSLCGIKQEYI